MQKDSCSVVATYTVQLPVDYMGPACPDIDSSHVEVDMHCNRPCNGHGTCIMAKELESERADLARRRAYQSVCLDRVIDDIRHEPEDFTVVGTLFTGQCQNT